MRMSGASSLARRNTSRSTLQGPLLQLRTGQAIEELRRGGHAEEVGEQDDRLLSLQAQELQLLGHAASDPLAADPLREIEVAPQQLHDRAVRHGAAEGHAGRLQLEGSFRLEPAQELVEQAGFADPRVARRAARWRPGPSAARRWIPASDASSRSRPTSGVSPRSLDTSSLVRPLISLLTAYARTGSVFPLTWKSPRSSKTKKPSRRCCVRRLTTIWPGLAMPRRRAARLVVSPTAV